VNLRTELVLRHSSATPGERRKLFGLRASLPDDEQVRGERLRWRRALRKE